MRLAGVAIDRIAEARTLPLQLPLPRDPRALRLAERLREDPSSPGRASPSSPAPPAPARARSSGCSSPRPACRSRSGASACACCTAPPARRGQVGDRGRARGRLFEHQRLHRRVPQALRIHALALGLALLRTRAAVSACAEMPRRSGRQVVRGRLRRAALFTPSPHAGGGLTDRQARLRAAFARCPAARTR